MARLGRILLVDDDPQVHEELVPYLQQEGWEVVSVYTAREAWQQLEQAAELFRVVILDLMLEHSSEEGYWLVRQLRDISRVPVLFLSQMTGHEHIIKGLDLGADDYILKPFDPAEVGARIRAVLRRYDYEEDPDRPRFLRVQDLELDPRARIVRRNQEEIELSPIEFGILMILAQRPGQPVSLQEISRLLWGTEEGIPRIKVHVRSLRTKLRDDPRNPRYVQTVRGIGYRLKP